jgi:hypothetical protein
MEVDTRPPLATTHWTERVTTESTIAKPPAFYFGDSNDRQIGTSVAPELAFPPWISGIALARSASQIALFVAPVLVPLVVMMLLATVTPMFVTNSGQSAWFVGVMVLMSI